jgi:hypothetical protein
MKKSFSAWMAALATGWWWTYEVGRGNGRQEKGTACYWRIFEAYQAV